MSSARTKGSGLEWFVRRGGSVRGPFSSTRVRHFVLEGKLTLEDEVSADRAIWQSIGSVDEVVPLQMRDDAPTLAPQQAAERDGDRLRAARAILVALLVVSALVIAVTLVGPQEDIAVRDCAAPPEPGVLLEGCLLDGAVFAAAQLSSARMANASLAGARLSGADLSGADLRYANLAATDLSYAMLNGADLKGANLRTADLTNADLSGADLSFADLGGVQLGGARFDGSRLEGAIWVDGMRCGKADCPR